MKSFKDPLMNVAEYTLFLRFENHATFLETTFQMHLQISKNEPMNILKISIKLANKNR